MRYAILGGEFSWEGGEGLDLSGKKVIAIGERDGVQATAIAAVARSAGAEVLLELNQCFV